MRILTPADAEAYLVVRLCALREQPPAFGSLPEDELNIVDTATRLAQSEDRCFFGAFQGSQLIGIIRLSRYTAPNERHRAYLGGLYVLPAFRRGGCGKALVEQALKQAASIQELTRVNLTVVTGQEAAIRLYQSLGFRIYGTERETFSNAGKFYDEHLMTLELTGKATTPENGIANSFRIRPYRHDDAKAIVGLWQRCGLVVPHNDPQKDIARKLLADPDGFLVGELGGAVIASCMVGYDGHRGWINYLAVDPSFQKLGFARQIMEAAETHLRVLGCPKIQLLVRKSNGPVAEFYRKLGFQTDEVFSFGKRLESDLPTPDA